MPINPMPVHRESAWLVGAAAPRCPGVPDGLGGPGALPMFLTHPALQGLTCTPLRAA